MTFSWLHVQTIKENLTFIINLFVLQLVSTSVKKEAKSFHTYHILLSETESIK